MTSSAHASLTLDQIKQDLRRCQESGVHTWPLKTVSQINTTSITSAAQERGPSSRRVARLEDLLEFEKALISGYDNDLWTNNFNRFSKLIEVKKYLESIYCYLTNVISELGILRSKVSHAEEHILSTHRMNDSS